MPDWSLITNHGLVMAAVAKHPHSTARQLGDAVGITERATHAIIKDLEAAGYIIKTKVGRRNEYLIDPSMPVKIKASDATVGEFLRILGWKPRKKGAQGAPAKKDGE